MLAKYADAMSQTRAKEMAAGSGMYPRDILLKAMRGRLYWWIDQDGWKWYSVAAVNDISEALDVLAQTVGDVLVRATDRWRAPLIGAAGTVLTNQGPGLPPAWQPLPTVVTVFHGALVNKLTNQNILTGTWTAVTFDNEVYDTDNLHDNAVNPSRLTVPAGWSQVRLNCNQRSTVNALGYRQVSIRKNGSAIPGGGLINWLPVNINSHPTQTPALDCSPGDYFEMWFWQNSGITLKVLNSTLNTYFSIEKVA